AARYREPAGPVQPADPWLQAQPALGGGFYRVRTADRVLQWRFDPCHEERLDYPGSCAGLAHGSDAKHVRRPAGPETDAAGAAGPRQGPGGGTAREPGLFWEGAVRPLPYSAILLGSPDARSPRRAFCQRSSLGADQDVYAARYQGESAVPS